MLKQIECAVSHCLTESYSSLSDRQTRIIILQRWGERTRARERETDKDTLRYVINFVFILVSHLCLRRQTERAKRDSDIWYSIPSPNSWFVMNVFLCQVPRHSIGWEISIMIADIAALLCQIKVNRLGVNRTPCIHSLSQCQIWEPVWHIDRQFYSHRSKNVSLSSSWLDWTSNGPVFCWLSGLRWCTFCPDNFHREKKSTDFMKDK